MGKPFKNALCLAFRPDAYGYKFGDWHQCCHRRAGHDGPHWNNGRQWYDGDEETQPREEADDGV